MVKKLNGRWFLILTTTQSRTVRIAIDQIAVLNDEGPTCGIVTNTGFVAAIGRPEAEVWAIMETAVDPTPAQTQALHD